MLEKLSLAWYRFEYRILTSVYRRFERIKDDPNKDGEARLNAALSMIPLIDRKRFLEERLGLA